MPYRCAAWVTLHRGFRGKKTLRFWWFVVGLKCVILSSDGGVYLYLSSSADDVGCFADEWYESVDDATAACLERFGVAEAMWQDVPDPEPGCQHDWIEPVRVRGRAEGHTEWGVLERRVNGEWIKFT